MKKKNTQNIAATTTKNAATPLPQKTENKTFVDLSSVKMPALNLTPDALQINTPKLMGRQSAGQGFMRAFINAYGGPTKNDTLSLITYSTEQAKIVEGEIRQLNWKAPINFIPAQNCAAWTEVELFYCPAPIASTVAWARARRGAASFAMCGVTHTISSTIVMNQIASYLRDPFMPWDALICTSNSVKRAVERIWAAEREALAYRFGAIKQPDTLMTPIIPLGICTDDFVSDDALRARARLQFKFTDNEIVVLFVGRLCLHAKANPLPMYLALARAAKRTGKSLHFLECGWFANDSAKRAYDEAVALAGIKLSRVDGRTPGTTKNAYLAADIFISLSDNIQETFGLTPIEAMAAGLPVIVSDWDGYRETVRDGIDGILIPSYQPSSLDAASDLSFAYEDERISYDHYVGYSHIMVSVDVHATAQALERLIIDPALRKTMGESGRARAKSVYDWGVVFKQYQALWGEQDHIRRAVLTKPIDAMLKPRYNPRFLNPLDLFAHYPSHVFSATTKIARDASNHVIDTAKLRELIMWGFVGTWIPNAAFIQKALNILPLSSDANDVGTTLDDWAGQLAITPARAERIAAWLHKVGLIRCVDTKRQACAQEDGA